MKFAKTSIIVDQKTPKDFQKRLLGNFINHASTALCYKQVQCKITNDYFFVWNF